MPIRKEFCLKGYKKNAEQSIQFAKTNQIRYDKSCSCINSYKINKLILHTKTQNREQTNSMLLFF